jgi:hypothetical protein
MSLSGNTFAMQCRSQQRQRQTLLGLQNNTGTRLNVTCPPEQYTTQQLNMRRKAEILQYKQNANSRPTANQRWSWLVTQNKGAIYCEDIRTTPTPSSSSDVPGPVIMLYKDNSVPLTRSRNDQYIRFTDVPYTNYNYEWAMPPEYDVVTSNNSTGIIGHLATLNPNTTSMNFTSTVPVSLSIRAKLYHTNSAAVTNVATIDMIAESAKMYLFYNDTLVANISADISMLDRVTISTLDSTDDAIYASKYIGSLYFPTISLNTYQSNVFTIRLEMNIMMNLYDDTGAFIPNSAEVNVYNSEVKFIGNLTSASDEYFYSETNCVVEYPPNANTFQAFSFTSI